VKLKANLNQKQTMSTVKMPEFDPHLYLLSMNVCRRSSSLRPDSRLFSTIL